jgi:hypothetical protein
MTDPVSPDRMMAGRRYVVIFRAVGGGQVYSAVMDYMGLLDGGEMYFALHPLSGAHTLRRESIVLAAAAKPGAQLRLPGPWDQEAPTKRFEFAFTVDVALHPGAVVSTGELEVMRQKLGAVARDFLGEKVPEEGVAYVVTRLYGP